MRHADAGSNSTSVDVNEEITCLMLRVIVKICLGAELLSVQQEIMRCARTVFELAQASRFWCFFPFTKEGYLYRKELNNLNSMLLKER